MKRLRVFSGNRTKKDEETLHELMHKATVDILYAPAGKIMKLGKITMEAPKKARIFASVTCEECGESVADEKTRKVRGKVLCIPCAKGEHLQKRFEKFR